MLTVNSAKLLKDVNDFKKETLYFASEEYDKLEFKDNQPFIQTIAVVVDYHITEKVDEGVVFRIRTGKDVIHETEHELKISYDGESKDEYRHYTIRDVHFHKSGLYEIDIIFGGSVLKTISLELTQA